MLNIGERLREERERLGFNQADFGALSMVTKTTQFNYESGKRMPDAAYLSAIAAAGADVQYIISGIRSAPPALGTEEVRKGYAVDVLNKEEQALLDNYRHCQPEGKAAIKAVGVAVAKSGGVKKGRRA